MQTHKPARYGRGKSELLMDKPMQNTPLESAIERALKVPPAVRVPVDFALQVMATLPTSRRGRRHFGMGNCLGAIAAAALLVAAFAIAPHAVPSMTSVAFDAEMVVVAELMGVVAWLAWRWEGQV